MATTVRLYRIEEVVRTAGITRRALRVYQEYGLVEPVTSAEGLTLYSDDAVESLRRINRLRNDLGVNLAGVQIIIEMRHKMEELQRSLEEITRFVRDDLQAELASRLRAESRAIVPASPTKPPKLREG